jgi:hypothetical protein
LGKADFRAKMIIRDKEEHYIIITGSIIQEIIRIINVYMPDKDIKVCNANTDELHGEIHKCTIKVGNFSTLLLIKSIFFRQKISKDRVELKSTINQPDLIAFVK